VFRATVAEVPQLAGALARAFDDDPVMTWIFPDPETRPKRLAGLFALTLRRHHLRHGEVWTTEGLPGAAAWCAPGQWRIPTGDQLRNLPSLLRLIGPRLFTRLGGMAESERRHPGEAHWYLATLGLEPAAQGRGLGSDLLRPVLERCDAEGLGAYLECSKRDNIAFYRRHGFDVTCDIQLGDGPTVWGMWRPPK
jgi:ribosomal protein S18 acetylase RimI-like enzyme